MMQALENKDFASQVVLENKNNESPAKIPAVNIGTEKPTHNGSSKEQTEGKQ